MLKKLDIYIIKKFLATFFFVVLIFTMIAVVIDFSEKVEEFIDEDLGTKQVVSEYYINFLLFINGMLWPLFTLISVIFFTSRMAANSEIISMLNAGMSFRRLMVPYLLAGGAIASIHLFGNHIVIPMANKEMFEFIHKYVEKEKDKGKTRDVHMFISPNEKIYVRDYFKRDSLAKKFRWETFEGNELKVFIKAEKAQWKGLPNHWELTDYEIRTFDNLKETFKIEKKEKLDTTINLLPSDFVRYDDTKNMIPTPQLKDFVEEERQRGIGNTKIYEIELYRRTADPFTIFIVTIIGMAVASRKVRGGLGLNLALGVALGAVYIFLSRFSITIATNQSLSPFVGVWLPNMLFGFIALILIFRAQK
ncbi:MAG: LptF/LptG family permease [Bacteroidetes bacterium]|nr:LptF/LptG family permease [Bacteroidota bacterium]MDF1864043.1 LptF/LptG family permease [Saprospiraceae bacterium]